MFFPRITVSSLRPSLLAPLFRSFPRSFAPDRSASPFFSITSALFVCLPWVSPRAFPQFLKSYFNLRRSLSASRCFLASLHHRLLLLNSSRPLPRSLHV